MSGFDDSSSSRIAKANSPGRKTGQHDASGDGPPKENPITQECETPLPHKCEVAHQLIPRYVLAWVRWMPLDRLPTSKRTRCPKETIIV